MIEPRILNNFSLNLLKCFNNSAINFFSLSQVSEASNHPQYSQLHNFSQECPLAALEVLKILIKSPLTSVPSTPYEGVQMPPNLTRLQTLPCPFTGTLSPLHTLDETPNAPISPQAAQVVHLHSNQCRNFPDCTKCCTHGQTERIGAI